MAAYKASMCLATSNNYVLPGAASNDFIVYTGNPAQSTLFGVSNVGVFMRVDGTGNVAFAGNVGFSNQVVLSGVQLTQRTSTTTNNVTAAVTSVNGFAKSAGNVTISMDNGSNYIALSRSNVELARINSNGWLGLGTQTAQSVLHAVAPGIPLIVDGSSNYTYITLSNSSNGAAHIGLAYNPSQFSTSAGSNDLVIKNNHPQGKIHLQNGSTTAALTINSNNNVGIGNSNPLYRLTVTPVAATSSFPLLDFRNEQAYGVFATSDNIGGRGNTLRFQSYDYNGGANNTRDVLIMRPEGYVGLGTSAPSYILDVAGTSTADSARVTGNMILGGAQQNYFKGAGIISNQPGLITDVPSGGCGVVFASGGSIAFCASSSEKARITSTGYLGIGTNAPSYPLHITNSASWALPGTGYFFQVNTSTLTTIGGSGSANISIYASSGGIVTYGAFMAPSDRRIKTILGSNTECLPLLEKIDVYRYKHIDTVMHGNHEKYGFVAQELVEQYPPAVSVGKGFVPDVFKLANASGSTVALDGHGLQEGDRVRMIAEDNSSKEFSVVAASPSTFEIDGSIDGQVFVYGKEVDDFHTIDADSLVAVAVAAIKEMATKVQSMEARLSALESRMQTT